MSFDYETMHVGKVAPPLGSTLPSRHGDFSNGLPIGFTLAWCVHSIFHVSDRCRLYRLEELKGATTGDS